MHFDEENWVRLAQDLVRSREDETLLSLNIKLHEVDVSQKHVIYRGAVDATFWVPNKCGTAAPTISIKSFWSIAGGASKDLHVMEGV